MRIPTQMVVVITEAAHAQMFGGLEQAALSFLHFPWWYEKESALLCGFESPAMDLL